MASSKGNSEIAKPKLEELPLIFCRFFENTCAVDTQQKIYICKNCYLCKKVKLVERVQRYTNADMKICQFLRFLMKIIR